MRPSARNSDAVGGGGGARVVRDHHGRLAVDRDGVAQQVEHRGARGRVEVARRLVGEQHGRARDQRAGDRDALLLAAGQLGRLVVAALGQADAVQQRVDLRGRRLAAARWRAAA